MMGCVKIAAIGRTVSAWGVYENAAAVPPESPACAAANAAAASGGGGDACGAPTPLTLVPHGGTDLRIGEFPLSGF